MNDSLKKVLLQSLKTAVTSTVIEIGDFLDAILDESAKQALVDTAEEFKQRINRTHENPPKKT